MSSERNPRLTGRCSGSIMEGLWGLGFRGLGFLVWGLHVSSPEDPHESYDLMKGYLAGAEMREAVVA